MLLRLSTSTPHHNLLLTRSRLLLSPALAAPSCFPCCVAPAAAPPLPQVPRAISADQIRSICAPYGEIVDLSVMAPKRDNAMGARGAVG